MKVLLIAPKDSPTYLNSLYASLRVQVGTCDLYALDDKQSADISAFFNHFVKLRHYDRIVLMYDGDSCAPCRRLPCCASNTTPRSGAKK